MNKCLVTSISLTSIAPSDPKTPPTQTCQSEQIPNKSEPKKKKEILIKIGYSIETLFFKPQKEHISQNK